MTDTDTIINGTSDCTLPIRPEPAIAVSYLPQLDVCTGVSLDIEGGVPPYRVSMLAGSEGMYASTRPFNSTLTLLQNSVVGDQQFALFVSDAADSTSLVSQQFTSLAGMSTCALRSASSVSGSASLHNGGLPVRGGWWMVTAVLWVACYGIVP